MRQEEREREEEEKLLPAKSPRTNTVPPPLLRIRAEGIKVIAAAAALLFSPKKYAKKPGRIANTEGNEGGGERVFSQQKDGRKKNAGFRAKLIWKMRISSYAKHGGKNLLFPFPHLQGKGKDAEWNFFEAKKRGEEGKRRSFGKIIPRECKQFLRLVRASFAAQREISCQQSRMPGRRRGRCRIGGGCMGCVAFTVYCTVRL